MEKPIDIALFPFFQNPGEIFVPAHRLHRTASPIAVDDSVLYDSTILLRQRACQAARPETFPFFFNMAKCIHIPDRAFARAAGYEGLAPAKTPHRYLSITDLHSSILNEQRVAHP